MGELKATVAGIVSALVLGAILVVFLYGIYHLNELGWADKKERVVAIITRGFNITSEDAELIFDICRYQ